MAAVEGTQVEKNFQSNKLPTELIPGLIPGIGAVSITKLKGKGIDTPDKLFAVYFQRNRSSTETQQFLEKEVTLRDKDAHTCVHALELKLGRDVL